MIVSVFYLKEMNHKTVENIKKKVLYFQIFFFFVRSDCSDRVIEIYFIIY